MQTLEHEEMDAWFSQIDKNRWRKFDILSKLLA